MKEEMDVEYQPMTAVAVRERSSVLLMPVMDVQTAMARLQQFQGFINGYLSESKDGGNDGGDYGIIPGTKKKTLLKSGADKLCEVYGLYDEYVVISNVEDWEKGLFDYTLKCQLKSRRDDSMVGTGVGSCSSFESKYRWREQQRKCPKCGMEAIIKGKDFNNTGIDPGWLCWSKKGGCNSKFVSGDKSIEGQALGRVDNPDIVDIKNTVLKMAKKRAKIDAVIGATRSSGIFTQDLDELVKVPEAVVPPEKVITEPKVFGKKPAAENQNVPLNPGFSHAAALAGNHTPAPPDETLDFEPLPPLEELVANVAKTKTMDTKKSDGEFIDLTKQNWLRLEFQKLLPTKYQATAISDQLRRGWLKSEGFVNAKDEGTSTVIPEKQFKAVAAALLNFAKSQHKQ